MFMRRALTTFITPAVILIPLLVSCSGGTSTSKQLPECSGSAGEIGPGLLCADGGFRVAQNDFAFPNWVGVEGTTDKPDSSLLIRLFGAKAVCTSGTTKSDCVLHPSAQATLEQWTEALDGGHCEGMATLSMRYYLGIQDTTNAEAGASTAAALTRPNTAIDQEINLWWATQFVPEVRVAAAASRQKTPTELVGELIQGLRNGAGYTIGIYADGFGHAVTPFAVTKNSEKYTVHIYDNNFPGKPKFMTINSLTNRWEYTDGSQNLNGTPYTWEGSTGTFELTPMNVRTGPFSDEFGAVAEEAKGATLVTMSTKGSSASKTRQDAAGLLVTTSSGKRIGVSNGTLVNEIPGAEYTIGKGGLGSSLVLVELPEGEAFTVDSQLVTPSQTSKDREITVSVITPDGSRTDVRTTKRLSSTSSETPELEVNVNREITVRPRGKALITVSNNKDSIQVALPAKGQLTTKQKTAKDKSLVVTGSDAKGKQLVTKQLPKAKIRSQEAPASSSPRSTTPESIVPQPTLVPTTLVRRSTSTTLVPHSTTSTLVPRSTSTTLVPRTTTTTLVPRSTSTTLVRRSTTTTVLDGIRSTTIP